MPLCDDPKLQRWLKRLKPCDELVVRLAIMEDVHDPDLRRQWEARIHELEESLHLTEEDICELLKSVMNARKGIGQLGLIGR
jgi:hypothetical protein